MNKFWDRSPVFPKNGREVIFEWMKACKIGGEKFKNVVNENFKQLEELSDEST